MNQIEDTSVNDDRLDEPKDLTQPGPSQVNDSVNNNSNLPKIDDEKSEVKDYEYWNLLGLKKLFSGGIGAETREEVDYCLRKRKEAERNGTAEDEEKDYDYWFDLFIERFKSPRIDNECKEDMDYFYKKMQETKEYN